MGYHALAIRVGVFAYLGRGAVGDRSPNRPEAFRSRQVARL